ncbi:Chromatin accessibility complex protein 1, partial [Stegodyphus mimosarum]
MTDKQSKLALLPLSRIKMIMKSSPDVSNISPDSIFLIAKAAEGFVAFLVRQALKASDNKMLVDYSDLSKVVYEIDNLEFLRDIIPPTIKAYKYLEIFKKVEEHEKAIAKEEQEI